jgi:hypothetical protein
MLPSVACRKLTYIRNMRCGGFAVLTDRPNCLGKGTAKESRA